MQSDLINSYAWDTAIVYLQTFDNRKNNNTPYALQNSLNSSTLASKGTNNLTSDSERDIICNIYDMASNTGEWTTETYSLINQPYVTRGGGFNYLDGATRNRYYNTIEYIFSFHSFRPILYL